MVNKDNIGATSPSGSSTGLDFEIPVSTGLVFEAEIDRDEDVVEQVAEAETPKEPPLDVVDSVVVGDEFDIPESFDADEADGFIVDPLNKPTYIPRFTEVSDTYRMRDDIRDRVTPSPSRVVIQEDNVAEQADIIPEDEQRPLQHIVISQNSSPSETRDDSVTIIKFKDEPDDSVITNDEEDVAEEDEVAREVEELLIPQEPTEEPTEPDDQLEPEEVEADSAPPADEAVAPVAQEVAQTPVAPLVYPVALESQVSDEEEHSPDTVPDESDDSGKRGEYVTVAQRDSFKDRFLDSIMSVKVRIVVSAALFLAMLAMDALRLFGVDIVAAVGLGDVTGARAIIDVQFAAALLLLAIPEVIRSLKLLLRGVVSPEIMMIPSFAVVLINGIIVFVSATGDHSGFGLLFAVQAIVAMLADYHRLAADFGCFKVISRTGVKQILDKRLTRTLERENLALDGAVDEYKSRVARMFRTSFVSDFNSRTSKVVENSGNVILMGAISLGVALVSAVVAYFIAGPTLEVASGAFSMVFLLSFPTFSFLTHKLAFHSVELEAGREKGAYVGERSVLSSADIDVVAYDDVEIFGTEDVSIKNMDVYGTADISTALLQMSALFNVAGGPLARVFSATSTNSGATASDVRIEDDGISGLYMGHRICAGTKEYMARHGVSVAAEDRRAGNIDSTRAMYGAEDGRAHVIFHIRYSFSEEFTMLLPHLKEQGIVPLIYTRDPNITNELLRVLTFDEDVIRVMKKNTLPPEGENVYRRVSAGIVTLGTKLDAVNLVLLSKKYTKYHATIASTELVAMLLGAGLSAAFAVTGTLTIPVVVLAAIQLAWCVYLYLRTAHTFGDKKKKKGN